MSDSRDLDFPKLCLASSEPLRMLVCECPNHGTSMFFRCLSIRCEPEPPMYRLIRSFEPHRPHGEVEAVASYFLGEAGMSRAMPWHAMTHGRLCQDFPSRVLGFPGHAMGFRAMPGYGRCMSWKFRAMGATCQTCHVPNVSCLPECHAMPWARPVSMCSWARPRANAHRPGP